MNDLSPRNKYLVCVSHKEVAKSALRLACLKAKKDGHAVALLHVIEPADFQSLFAVADKLREERREEAEKLLAGLGDFAQALGVTPSLDVREGVRGEEIIKATLEDPDISMLFIGVETPEAGQTGLISWLVARMGDRLLVPVLLVPGNLTDQQIEELV